MSNSLDPNFADSCKTWRQMYVELWCAVLKCQLIEFEGQDKEIDARHKEALERLRSEKGAGEIRIMDQRDLEKIIRWMGEIDTYYVTELSRTYTYKQLKTTTNTLCDVLHDYISNHEVPCE